MSSPPSGTLFYWHRGLPKTAAAITSPPSSISVWHRGLPFEQSLEVVGGGGGGGGSTVKSSVWLGDGLGGSVWMD